MAWNEVWLGSNWESYLSLELFQTLDVSEKKEEAFFYFAFANTALAGIDRSLIPSTSALILPFLIEKLFTAIRIKGIWTKGQESEWAFQN